MKTIPIILLMVLSLRAQEFTFDVLVKGKPAERYANAGKEYIQGVNDAEFTLRFKNASPARVLIIPTVDGLNTVDAKTNQNAESSGYIVGAGQTYEIQGWRTSLQEVRKFVFVTKQSGDTYAEKLIGSTRDCGVIGLKVIREVVWTPRTPGIYFDNTLTNFNLNTPAIPDSKLSDISIQDGGTQATSTVDTLASLSGALTSANTQVSGFDLGAQFGAVKQSAVHETEFDRGAEAKTFTIYYASLDGLRSLGVDIFPKAFAQVERKFCPVP